MSCECKDNNPFSEKRHAFFRPTSSRMGRGRARTASRGEGNGQWHEEEKWVGREGGGEAKKKEANTLKTTECLRRGRIMFL